MKSAPSREARTYSGPGRAKEPRQVRCARRQVRGLAVLAAACCVVIGLSGCGAQHPRAAPR